MSDAYDQLVAALRAITAQTSDPLPIIAFALQVVEHERRARRKQARARGPYGPDAPKIRAERMS
ncbi:hypothetical protein [Methylobacterium dankookense]|uniref:Uncharacterized protein n=1 Tax=Methylobacterium dankookense TaxID=560405 RepID=A0A564G1R5_9HYPH|nr:hypothetical protein [Methylobacterium dankookense]GJD57426.1 hypothetical protein IFDJLNFL_3327 [Methylobacterium dankookense]VUF13910.1 hypothetical protein MTDSW087_03618 [Methylobacterium dankookense]